METMKTKLIAHKSSGEEFLAVFEPGGDVWMSGPLDQRAQAEVREALADGTIASFTDDNGGVVEGFDATEWTVLDVA